VFSAKTRIDDLQFGELILDSAKPQPVFDLICQKVDGGRADQNLYGEDFLPAPHLAATTRLFAQTDRDLLGFLNLDFEALMPGPGGELKQF
jgi:hypothetical protein